MRVKHNHLLDKVIYTGASSLLLLMIVLGLVLSSSSVSAVCTTDSSTGVVSCSETKNASVTVSLACTLSATVDSAHTATIEPGTVRGLGNAGGVNGIGQTTIKASCNDSGGYAIYAIGYTGDTYGTTTLVGNNTGETITTGTSTSGNASNWAMQINSVSGTYAPVVQNSFDSSSYHVIPDTFTMVAKRESATDAGVSAEGSKITATYGAYIAGTQLADTYEGKVKYVLVHPNTMVAGTYTINYLANGGSGTMTNSTVTGLYNFESQILAENGYTAPSGYQFAGWCTTNTAGYYDCDGTSYAAGATLSASPSTSATANGTMNLYAYWSKLPYSSCPTSPMISTAASGITYMQDITNDNRANVLSALTTNTTYQIKDNRDNETYCVAKLADGKLWMLDNLALDLTDSTILSNLSSDNTNASTGLPYLKGNPTRDPNTDANGQYATAAVSNWTSSLSYSAPLVNITNKYVVPTDATSTAGGYKVGGYYNYCAASAGSYCYGNGTNAGTSSGNATESICPAGWRMPTGDTSGEFSALANAIYGSTSSTSDAIAYANYRSALHLPLSGNFLSGSAVNQGSSGYWWSSTRGNNDVMPNLGGNTSTINPANASSRLVGSSLRCVAGS